MRVWGNIVENTGGYQSLSQGFDHEQQLRKMFPDLTILIPAAGSGERLGMGPKALLELNSRPLIYWVTQKALKLSDDVVVAVPRDRITQIQDLCPGCRCIPGGSSRQKSVASLLAASDREWVMLIDVARPFSSLDLCRAVANAARTTGVAGAFLMHDVPVGRLVNGELKQIIEAKEAGLFQSPQAFSRRLLNRVYRLAEQEGWRGQSTIELVNLAGHSVTPVAGEKNNIKLTTRFEWQLAGALERYLE